MIHYIKLKQQQCKNTRHNELLSTTICPHCSLFTCPGICTWLPSLTLPNATSKLLRVSRSYLSRQGVIFSPALSRFLMLALPLAQCCCITKFQSRTRICQLPQPTSDHHTVCILSHPSPFPLLFPLDLQTHSNSTDSLHN